MIQNKIYSTFDDVMLVPQYSDIESRSEVNISQEFLGIRLEVPILSAAMDTVTGHKMAIALNKVGALGVLHRFDNLAERMNTITIVSMRQEHLAFSIGIKDTDGLQMLRMLNWGLLNADESPVLPHVIINIDVAHGDHSGVIRTIEYIKKNHPRAKIIAGNVATASGYYRLAQAGADAIKVGIGGSSVCTTRIVTGHGVPTLASVMECYEARLAFPNTRMIADGGIENSGHIVKALAAGADVVMLGTLLSGADEAPGRKVEINGEVFKEYRGQSTVGSNQSTYAPEGVSGYTKAKGPVADIIKLLAGGIRSGLSYSGSRNLEEFRESAEFINVSRAAVEESKPRLMNFEDFVLEPV